MTDTHEAHTPADAYERWVGSQSVSEFLGDDTPEAAVDGYIAEITASPHGGPVEQYGCEPTDRERDLLVEYVRAHTPQLLGAAEAAALLGWDRRKLSVYHGRGLLPKPIQQLASGPVWRRQSILRYAPVNAVYVHTNGGDYVLTRNGTRLGVDPQVMADFRAAEGQLNDWANWSSPELWDGVDIMAAARETGDVVALYQGSVLIIEDEDRWAERIEFFGPRN